MSAKEIYEMELSEMIITSYKSLDSASDKNAWCKANPQHKKLLDNARKYSGG